MKTDGNKSAYPSGDQNNVQPEYGMSIREYFAAMAMQGMLANDITTSVNPDELICSRSVEMADILIAELNKKNQS